MTRIRRALFGIVIATVAVGSVACSSTAGAASTPSPARSANPHSARIVLPAHPRVYFYGDSWTHGASAAPGRGFPAVVGQALGWRVQLGPDNSGSGYVHTYVADHPVLPQSAAALPPIHADLIVLEAGTNDIPGPLDHFWNAVKQTVRTLKRKSHGAPVVLVGPASFDGTVPEGLSAIDYEEAGAAAELRIPYVSPLKEHWFNAANIGPLFDPETIHPNTAGHAYYGGRLASALTAITVEH